MDVLKKIVRIIQDFVELILPIAALLIMFATFVIEIFARYLFNNPLPWAYEVTVMCYLWMVMLGACFTERKKGHVTFTLLYDKMGVKGKAILGFLGNLIIIISLIYMFIPTCQMVGQMKMQVTSVFKIGLNIVYFPAIPFMILMIIYVGLDMINEFKVLFGIGGEKEVQKMLNATKSETEETIEMALSQEEEGK